MGAFKVTLTFDNGPEPDVTPHVLEELRRRGIRSTFFVLGEKLEDGKGGQLLRSIRDDGHWIGNHTYSHLSLGTKPDCETAIREIGLTQKLIGEHAHPRRFFRPTGGGGTIGPMLLSAAAVRYLIAHRYSLAFWNVVPEDWIYPDNWVETAVEQCLSKAHATVVLHDLPTGAMEHLGAFMDRIMKLGGTFVQELPASCLPLDRGIEKTPLTPYVVDPEQLIAKEKKVASR